MAFGNWYGDWAEITEQNGNAVRTARQSALFFVGIEHWYPGQVSQQPALEVISVGVLFSGCSAPVGGLFGPSAQPIIGVLLVIGVPAVLAGPLRRGPQARREREMVLGDTIRLFVPRR